VELGEKAYMTDSQEITSIRERGFENKTIPTPFPGLAFEIFRFQMAISVKFGFWKIRRATWIGACWVNI
jgi:hypothetical protein